LRRRRRKSGFVEKSDFDISIGILEGSDVKETFAFFEGAWWASTSAALLVLIDVYGGLEKMKARDKAGPRK